MSLVILEGSDGAGKTTFARRLTELAESQRRNVALLHKGPPDPARPAVVEYTEDLRFYEPSYAHERLVVCDRWHLGEVVYGPLKRGRSRLSGAQLNAVEAYLDSVGALKLVLDAEDETLVARAFTERGESFVTRDDIPVIRQRYLGLAAHLRGWRVVRTDVADYHLGGILRSADRLESAVIDREVKRA